MILPDVNVLVHAHNSDSAVRITTHPRVLVRPLPVADVLDRVESWLRLPHVHIPQPSSQHFHGMRANLEALGTAGNLTTDAHLATRAMQRGYVLYSTDADFMRFRGLRWVSPCR